MNNFKIKKIQFKDHPILGDLEVDFCDKNGEPVDTIIIAGENGAGKSTLIDCIYMLTLNKNEIMEYSVNIEVIECNTGVSSNLKYKCDRELLFCEYNNNQKNYVVENGFKNLYPFLSIYSDVDINFKSENIRNVSFGEVDKTTESRKSSGYLAQEIKQLLVDIRAMDSEDLTKDYRQAKKDGNDTSKLILDRRLSRFTNAFNYMFDDIEFFGIENETHRSESIGYKNIIFKKGDVKISIDDLSSGEKQIVYRNSFLLKDQNALKGAFVFIDEPEISLHPKWQEKILDNYKRIFTDENGVQTSQIFVVTHSPFIIHNENRKNDKVIVLQKGVDGKITASDKPEYFKCNSVELVQDAFNLKILKDTPTVYLEGKTDEQYFIKAAEVFSLNLPFIFSWVGYEDENGNAEYTGSSNLEKAYHFLKARKLSFKNICLFDCDTKVKNVNENNVYKYKLKYYSNKHGIKVGIENALCLPEDFKYLYFVEYKEIATEIGVAFNKPELQKVELCEHICGLPNDDLKLIFANLKKEIEELITIFNQ